MRGRKGRKDLRRGAGVWKGRDCRKGQGRKEERNLWEQGKGLEGAVSKVKRKGTEEGREGAPPPSPPRYPFRRSHDWSNSSLAQCEAAGDGLHQPCHCNPCPRTRCAHIDAASDDNTFSGTPLDLPKCPWKPTPRQQGTRHNGTEPDVCGKTTPWPSETDAPSG